jgi:hypothetical protein
LCELTFVILVSRKIEIKIRVGLQVWLIGGFKEGLPSDPPREIGPILRVFGVWGAQKWSDLDV